MNKNQSLLERIARPNFFPGQLIDYRDFNRLAAQADRVLSSLCQYLFTGGGVLESTLENLSVVTGDDLKVIVKPGIAITPSGDPVVLAADKIVDLQPFRSALRQGAVVVVSLKNQVKGIDRFTDQQDASITGFRQEAFEPEFVMGLGAPVPQSTELFRVVLSPETKALRLPERHEEWEDSLGDGVIDLRFRTRIVPQTYTPTSGAELLQLRRALFVTEGMLRELERLYLVEDPFRSQQYLTHLHAEILARPFQPLKLSFLVAEFADKLSRYFESLVSKVGGARSTFDKATMHEIVLLLDRLKVREVLPSEPNLSAVIELAKLLEKFIQFASERCDLVHTIEEALMDIRDRQYEFDHRVVLAGHLFEKIDGLEVDEEARYLCQSDSVFVRSVAAQYENGDHASRKGKFIREGHISFEIQVTKPDRPVVLLFNQYIRRGGFELAIEVNGRAIALRTGDLSQYSNRWVNAGVVIPTEILVPQGNQVRVRVERSDLDFGFFGATAYQPVLHKERAL